MVNIYVDGKLVAKNVSDMEASIYAEQVNASGPHSVTTEFVDEELGRALTKEDTEPQESVLLVPEGVMIF